MTTPLLVSPSDIAAHPEWRIFDCRHDLGNPHNGVKSYQEGHIPAALHAHLDQNLSSPASGSNGRHPLPDPAAFVAWLESCGLQPQDHVVVYDADSGAFAARLWWLLRAVGHTRVSVLDGGFAAWQREGKPVSTTVPTFSPSRYSPWQWTANACVDVDAVVQNLASADFLVVDARAANRYAGQDETIDPVGGHIPGALNRPFTQNLHNGKFKDPGTLKQEFSEILGTTPATRVVNQCGSGVTACHNILAMELAGLHGSRLYGGSWSEWCSSASRPVATGSRPL